MIGASPGLTLAIVVGLCVPVIIYVKYKAHSRLERIFLGGFTSGALVGAIVWFLMQGL